MTKKLLLINIFLSQTIILIVALVLKKLLVNDISLQTIFTLNLSLPNFIVLGLGSSALLLLQLLFHKYLPQEKLFDEINSILLEKFPLPVLALIFFGSAIVEELLFRGIVQNILGIWLASLLFSLIHVRYLKKIYILIEVYLMGLILGFSYHLTLSLWIPILSHFTINFVTAFLIKKGYIKMENKMENKIENS